MAEVKLLSVSQLSELTGKARKTITDRLEGIAVTPGPRGGHLYDPRVALERIYIVDIASEDLDLTVERSRLTKLQADKAELELKKLRGEVVVIEDVAAAVGTEYSRVRSRLLSISSKLAQPLSNETNPALVKDEIDREVFEALEELSADTNVEGLTHDSSNSEIESDPS